MDISTAIIAVVVLILLLLIVQYTLAALHVAEPGRTWVIIAILVIALVFFAGLIGIGPGLKLR